MFNLMLFDYILIVISILGLLYFYLTKDYGHFKNKGIGYKKAYPLFGSLSNIIFGRFNFYEFVESLYTQSKKDGLYGLYQQNKPILVLGTQELVKLATIKDFEHFTDHRTFNTGVVFDKNLFNLKGQRWKNMRSTLSPAFTSSKLHYIFDLINNCAQNIDNYLIQESLKQKNNGNKDIIIKQEMKEFFTRFTNDAIATTAFGIEVDSLADPENEFFLMGKDLTNIFGGFRWMKFLVALFSERLFKLLFDKQFLSPKAIDYFSQVVQDNLKRRRNEIIFRPDIIQLLLEAQATKENSEDFTDDDIIAQAILFFFAGFDTISTTLALAVHQLAEYPDIQEKLHQEIDEKLKENNGQISYDILMKDLTYMDMVLNETQRRFPVLAFVDRVCTKQYKFPSTDNRPEYIIKPGEQIWIPIYGFHRDKEFFPEPDKLIPDRWKDESQHNLNVFMPFGIGPRMCIANRFARMETKLALLYTLKHFKIIFIDKTVHPIQFKTRGFSVQNTNGYWLGLTPR